MKTVEFLERQQPVKIIERDNKVYIYICLNGKQVIKEAEHDMNHEVEVGSAEKTITVWSYDYNEIIEQTGVLNIEDVKLNPQKYINYTVTEKYIPTTKEQIEILTKENALLKEQMETTQQAVDFLLLGAV